MARILRVRTRRGAGSKSRQIGIRFPLPLLKDVDRYVRRLRADNPGIPINRSDALRSLVRQALDAGAP